MDPTELIRQGDFTRINIGDPDCCWIDLHTSKNPVQIESSDGEPANPTDGLGHRWSLLLANTMSVAQYLQFANVPGIRVVYLVYYRKYTASKGSCIAHKVSWGGKTDTAKFSIKVLYDEGEPGVHDDLEVKTDKWEEFIFAIDPDRTFYGIEIASRGREDEVESLVNRNNAWIDNVSIMGTYTEHRRTWIWISSFLFIAAFLAGLYAVLWR